ncbi:LamG-like jellyroll fold domain-containing protein [Micromonospora sicca]|nr:LamG-like jellyroll fold domain-containing protein [Micromonospora sp. 4G51]
MKTSDNGYLFLLSGSGETKGKLTVLERAGATVNSHAVTLPYPIHPGEWHHVSVTVAGQRITTTLNGLQVDSFTDGTYPAGGVGFREWNGANLESARFDNAKVVAPDGSVLLADDFSSSDLASWVPPLAGNKISDNSCGGQPAHVAPLTGVDGRPVYMYFSDLWDFHTNEALANYHWEPLRFDADGMIQPLRCDNSVVALASGHPGQADPVPGLDQSSESGAFSHACPVALGARYGQTFSVGRSGPLTSIAVTVFKDGTEAGRVLRNPPTAPLDVRLTALTSDGVPDRTLWSASVRPERIGWSPRQLVLQPGLKVVEGQRLALVLATASPQGCYGVERDPGDPYAGGAGLVGDDQTLVPVAGSDVRFRTTIGAPAVRPVRLDPAAGTTVLAPHPDVPVLPGQPTRAVFRVANLTDDPIRVPVEVEPPAGYAASPETSTVNIGVGETAPGAVAVSRAATDPAAGVIRVRAGSGSVTAPVTPSDNLLRTAVVSASSTHDGWHPSRVNDGQIQAQHGYALWNGGGGWNDDDKSIFPDTLTAAWDSPVRVGSVRVRTIDAPQQPADQYGVRDFAVLALVDGVWRMVGRVSGNISATVDVVFPQVVAGALRLVVTASNDRGYSRVVELEGYA